MIRSENFCFKINLFEYIILMLTFQVGYVVGICGCIILFGIILNALLEREAENNDVSLFTFIFWPLLALLLALVYILLWFIVFRSWKKIRMCASYKKNNLLLIQEKSAISILPLHLKEGFFCFNKITCKGGG